MKSYFKLLRETNKTLPEIIKDVKDNDEEYEKLLINGEKSNNLNFDIFVNNSYIKIIGEFRIYLSLKRTKYDNHYFLNIFKGEISCLNKRIFGAKLTANKYNPDFKMYLSNYKDFDNINFDWYEYLKDNKHFDILNQLDKNGL